MLHETFEEVSLWYKHQQSEEFFGKRSREPNRRLEESEEMVGGAHPTCPAYFTSAAWILEAEPVGSV